MVIWYQKSDKFIGERIAADKYEKYESGLILNQINNDSVVVDVGANIGYYTILMAQKAKKVYAIEPEEKNFEILLKNIKENKLDNVYPVRAAAGKVNKTITVFVSEENYGDHRLFNPSGRTKTQKIDCLKLDDILKNEPRVDLIKIDTQGWEPEVIEGGKKVIERDRPTIFMEYWPTAYNQAGLDGDRMMEYLQDVYRHIWKIDDEINYYTKVTDKIKVDQISGYADVWLKSKMNMSDIIGQLGHLKVKKLIKRLLKMK